MERRTRCARGNPGTAGDGRALVPSIETSATYGFDGEAGIERFYESGEGYLYGRYGNPTVRRVEELLAELEGAEDACLFSSGMAAISSLFLTCARSGERIGAQRDVYGGAAQLLRDELPRAGIEVVWFDFDELAALPPERLAGCRLLYLEAPTNPLLRVLDLAAVAARAKAAGVPTAVDCTFATPILLRPREHGIDLVVHSATKYLGGHGDLIGGVICGDRDRIGRLALKRRHLGGVLDPFSAFLLHRGVGTLAVRMEAHCRAAETLAHRLEGHPAIRRVVYPGLDSHPDHAPAARQMSGYGGMVSFVPEGGVERACRFHDQLRLIVRAGSLGGLQSLISRPVAMSHRYSSPESLTACGITPDLLRLSVGLEAPTDLIADIEQALEASAD